MCWNRRDATVHATLAMVTKVVSVFFQRALTGGALPCAVPETLRPV